MAMYFESQMFFLRRRIKFVWTRFLILLHVALIVAMIVILLWLQITFQILSCCFLPRLIRFSLHGILLELQSLMMARVWSSVRTILFQYCGWRLHIITKDPDLARNIPPTAIFLCNHISRIDTALISCILPPSKTCYLRVRSAVSESVKNS